MLALSQDDEIEADRPGLDQNEGQLIPQFREKPNYLLTQQIVGDIKIFIKIMLTMTCQFYMPVIKETEMEDMKEDLVECITNVILSKDVYKIVFSFFRLEFETLEANLRSRFKEFKHITPGQ